jgi:hypothetical protein
MTGTARRHPGVLRSQLIRGADSKMRTSFLAAVLVAAIAVSTPAEAQLAALTVRPSVDPSNADNDGIDYGQFNVSADGGFATLSVPQPFESFGGVEGEIGERGEQFTITRQCCSQNLGGGFTADFGIGDWLLMPNPPSHQIVIKFKTPVSLVGTQLAKSGSNGLFIAQVQVFDHWNRPLGTFTETGNELTTFDNTAIFLGVRSNTSIIAKAVYTVTDLGGTPLTPVINFLSVSQ